MKLKIGLLYLTILLFIAVTGGILSCVKEPSTLTTTSINSTQPVSVVAENLDVPWSMAFLPDGSIIFTERSGKIRLVDSQKGLLPDPLLTISDVNAQGESGLLGITLHPAFIQNHIVYIYYTYLAGTDMNNCVVSYTIKDSSLTGMKVIIRDIPAGSIHDGGRIKFGPDGCLYITCGDAGNSSNAQDLNSLAGKILRLNDDGSIPSDNPFSNSPVYSYGHRNPEGMAWDSRGRLWVTEHGSSAHDEINLVEAGKNYGWPVILGDQHGEGMETPVINSGNDTWAPSGAAILNDSLFYTGLRGESLFKLSLDNPSISTLKRYFSGTYGRMRDVVEGPDGFIYIFTNNTDGRGSPRDGDDKLLKIDPRMLN
jgi:glucose/arabinose dehydrogenase